MTETWQSSLTREMAAEGARTPERLGSIGLSAVAPDAVAYCLQHGLRQDLLVAIDLMHQCFSSVEACHLRLEQDRDTGEAWLVLEVTLQEDVEEVLTSGDAYTDRWIAQVPWPQRDKIQLVYNVMCAMDPHDFHQLALQLANSPHAAELRTASSRADYATYHVGVALLESLGFRLSSGPAGHGDVRNRLSNSGDPEVMRGGNQLGQLQSQRIAADYRLRNTSVENPKTAQAVVQQAQRMMQILDACFAEPKRTQIMHAIQEWERKISRSGG